MKTQNRKILMAMIAFLISGCGSAGSTGGTGVTSTVNSPSEMGVGDILVVDMSEGEASLDFEGVVSDAEFILISGNSDSSSGTLFNIVSDITVSEAGASITKSDLDAEVDEGYGASELFSAWLRADEELLAESEPIPIHNPDVGLGKALSFSEEVGVGDVRSFGVLTSVYNLDEYAVVEAEARCVGQETVFFVDTRVTDEEFSEEEVREQCESFDYIAADEMNLLGDVSDVNDDGLVTVLVTPQVNMIGSQAGGIVAGYFYARDLYDGQNQQEIIFALAPDPNERYGLRISKSYYNDHLLPAVLPHELQHAISYNQHVFVNGGSAEEPWLNEGMSHLIEDLMGYGSGNPPRYSMFLASPSSTSLASSGSPGLSQRGAAYLFLRFLYEQSSDGSAFLRSLEDTSKRGIDNIESSFNGSDPNFDQFSEFMGRWSVALAMTDRGISSDPRYTYEPLTPHSETGNWKGARICGNADNGRGTILRGVHLNDIRESGETPILATSVKYFSVDTVPSWIDIKADNANDYAILIRTE